MSADRVRAIEGAIQEDLSRLIGSEGYRLWFRDVQVSQVSENRMTLLVPTEVHASWIATAWQRPLEGAVRRVLGPAAVVECRASRTQGLLARLRAQLPKDEAGWRARVSRQRPPGSFEGFLAHGERSRLALHALQLHSAPGQESLASIVLLCGPSGSGKTHLLRAAAWASGQVNPADVLYLRARDLSRRVGEALRRHRAGLVRALEVSLAARALLVVDDIHALAGRQATLGVLTRLLELSEAGTSRFIFASRVAPGEMGELPARLRSRLQAGLLLPMEAPPPSVVGEILRLRARTYGLDLSDEVLAGLLETSPRLSRAVEVLDRWAIASLELGESLGAWSLSEVAPVRTSAVRDEVADRIRQVVAEAYHIERGLLETPTKAKRARLPRRVAIYLLWRATASSLAELASSFGLKSHSGAGHALKVVEEERRLDPSFEAFLDLLLARI